MPHGSIPGVRKLLEKGAQFCRFRISIPCPDPWHHLMVHGRLLSSAELIESVESVSADRIRTFAGHLLTGGTPSVAVVGAGRKSKGYAERAGQTLAA